MDPKEPLPEAALEDLLDEFDQHPLNLTSEDKHPIEEEDPELAANIEKEYASFLQEMKSNTFETEGVEGLSDALGGLLKQLSSSLGTGEGPNSQDLKNMFEGNGEGGMEDFAAKLLGMFMKKDLLYEPLTESKTNYQKFFESHPKCLAEDMERYKKQFQILKEILAVLETSPDDIEKLMKLFEKMQEYGQPPEGIASLDMPM